jgi:hypothetical protein
MYAGLQKWFMAVMERSKHEQFAQLVSKGVSATKAYVSIGYSPKGARQSASRMLTNADVLAPGCASCRKPIPRR